MAGHADGSRILVVEDDADDTYLLTRQLAKAQIDDLVKVIEDGQEAYAFLTQAVILPIAAFVDLNLPGFDGIELLRRIREDSRLQSLPVIIMTGSSDPAHVYECNRLGVTAYLSKPIELTTFIRTVAHLFPKASASE